MQVYSAYFKIIRKHIIALLIYFVIFIGVSFLVTSSIRLQNNSTFSETKIRMAIIDNDGDSGIVNGLKIDVASKATIISLADNTEAIQDALFYGNVDYVLVIPQGFSNSLANGGSISLQRSTAAQSPAGVNMDLLINKYLDLAGLYIRNFPSMPQSEISNNVLHDLSLSSTVDFHANSEQANTRNMSYYFRFMAYSIMAILLMGITTIKLTFNEPEINKRNLCLPISPAKINMRLFVGDTALSLTVWAATCIVIFLLFGKVKLSTGILLLCVNSLVFTIACLGMAFLASKLIKNHVAMSAVANVISLGMSFLGGVFVEQELLGGTVTTIASFTPAYWYIRGVTDICNITQFSLKTITPLLNDMLIQLGFAAALIAIALVVLKQRKA